MFCVGAPKTRNYVAYLLTQYHSPSSNNLGLPAAPDDGPRASSLPAPITLPWRRRFFLVMTSCGGNEIAAQIATIITGFLFGVPFSAPLLKLNKTTIVYCIYRGLITYHEMHVHQKLLTMGCQLAEIFYPGVGNSVRNIFSMCLLNAGAELAEGRRLLRKFANTIFIQLPL